MSDMAYDVKVRRLIRRYGLEGYGLYIYIIERIVARLETESPTPDLEESSSDIAADTGMDTVLVEEIMWYCMEQGLFEQDEITGRMLAPKVYKFLAQSQTTSKHIRTMIAAYTKGNGDNLRLSQIIREESEEQNRTEQNRGETLTLGEYVSMSSQAHEKLADDYGASLIDDYVERIDLYCQSHGKRYKDYAATVRAWLKKDGVQKQVQGDNCPVCGAATPAGANCLKCGMQRMYWTDADKIAERREIAQEKGLI
jgi:hypothetical protein